MYLKYGYFHIPIAKEDVNKMFFFFLVRYDAFKYLVMLFGLIKRPKYISESERIKYYLDFLDSCIVIYLDNIFTFSHIKEDHVCDLNVVYKSL